MPNSSAVKAQTTKAYAPTPVVNQLQAIYQRDDAADCVALVWPEALVDVEIVVNVDNKRTRFVYCHSELAMREALVDHRDASERLVLLSKFDEVHLAKDVLARIWKNEPQRISPWKTLQQLIKVREVDPRLPKKNGRWMAEALLGCFDRFQEKIAFGEVLDQDNAWRALALGYLNYDEPALDLQSLFSWSISNDVSPLIKKLPSDVKDNLEDWLHQGIPQTSQLVQTLLLNEQGDDLLSIGLACSVMYYNGIESLTVVDITQLHISRGVFKERFLAGTTFDQHLLQQFGGDAIKTTLRVLKEKGHQVINEALGKTEQILASLDLLPAVELSEVLPGSLKLRFTRYAESLSCVLAGGEVEQAESALSVLKRHAFVGMPAQQESVERADMALRLARWLKQAPEQSGSAAKSISEYIQQGSYADWARSVVWSGDVHEVLNNVYQQLTERVSHIRKNQNQAFSQQLDAIARGDVLGDHYIPVENALERIVAPIAEKNPVLLLVLDGMSEAVFRELTEDLIKHHWLELKVAGNSGDQCLVAALPTVTKVSRCSLLSGRLAEGVANDEKKAFSGHALLKKIASTKYPPMIFHKQDLQQTGTGALNADVRAKLASTGYRVLAAVINAIDDQLSSSSQVSVNWMLDNVALLRQVLEAARESGRVVVITSDHGHVLDHHSLYQAPDSSSENNVNGERYQLISDSVSEHEVRVSGERVVTAKQSVVLPWTEQLRYTKSKNMGYHGGGSLQEVVIPFGVFVSAADIDVLEGWSEVPRSFPKWWYQESVKAEIASSFINPAYTDAKPARKPKKSKNADAVAEVMDDMFAATADAATIIEAATEPEAAAEMWIEDLFSSAVYLQVKSRVGRTGIKEEELRALIEFLDQHQGQAMEAAVLRYLEKPKIRLRGFLAGAQKLLNVDGYPILSVERDSQTIKLNIVDLKKQFEL